MLIDFHTHAFADSIAERAMAKLENTLKVSGRWEEPPATDGTVSGLLRKMDGCGIDRSVILPIATKPSQQKTINDWAADVMSDRLICFGSVHPDAEDVFVELERIKSLGLKGVKLHPDYQGFFANEERILPVYRKCAELGLPVILHAGLDAVSFDCIRCTPEMGADILEKVPEMTLILAHMGGNELWDDAEKYLVGKNVWFDMAFADGNISDEQAVRMIRAHGADRILFASDCPWHAPSREKAMLERLPLTESEREDISHRNAERLLNI